MRRRIGVSLALASAGSAAVVLLAVGLGAGLLADREARQRVDDDLRRRADEAGLVARRAEEFAAPALRDQLAGFQVWTADGRLVAGGSLPDGPLPAPTVPGFATVTVDGRRWRLHTVPADGALVQFAAALDGPQRAADERRGLALGLAAAGAAGWLGWLLGVRIARPLGRLRDEAATIRASADLTRRVA